MVDIRHPAGVQLPRQHLGRPPGPPGPQLRPLDGVEVRWGDGCMFRSAVRHDASRAGSAPALQPVQAPAGQFVPAADTAEEEDEGDSDQRVVAVGEELTARSDGVGCHGEEGPEPELSQIPVPQQRPQQPSHEEGDEGAADELAGGGAVGVFRWALFVAAAPYAGGGLGAGQAQPVGERGAALGGAGGHGWRARLHSGGQGGGGARVRGRGWRGRLGWDRGVAGGGGGSVVCAARALLPVGKPHVHVLPQLPDAPTRRSGTRPAPSCPPI